MLDIKQEIYNNIKNLSIKVKDNPEYKHTDLPYGILRTINVIPHKRKNSLKANWLVRFDVFSAYKGESQILDYYNNEISTVIDNLLANEAVTYAKSSCSIMDDKELGPITKHAVIDFAVETMEV